MEVAEETEAARGNGLMTLVVLFSVGFLSQVFSFWGLQMCVKGNSWFAVLVVVVLYT